MTHNHQSQGHVTGDIHYTNHNYGEPTTSRKRQIPVNVTKSKKALLNQEGDTSDNEKTPQRTAGEESSEEETSDNATKRYLVIK